MQLHNKFYGASCKTTPKLSAMPSRSKLPAQQHESMPTCLTSPQGDFGEGPHQMQSDCQLEDQLPSCKSILEHRLSMCVSFKNNPFQSFGGRRKPSHQLSRVKSFHFDGSH